MKAFVCSNFKKAKTVEVLPAVIEKLISIGIVPMLRNDERDHFSSERAVYGETEELISQADVIITVGGDGTILKWGVTAAKEKKPLLGINTGRLGFMATLESDELEKLSRLASGDYNKRKRSLLELRIEGEEPLYAVNDIVFFKSFSSKLPEFSVKKNEAEVIKLRADGLIFATASGSTAYSLSAGGPIIEPELNCVEVTPLCAHSLFGRTMVFTGEKPLSLTYSAYEGSQVMYSVDGSEGINIDDGVTAEIRRSELFFEIIDLDEDSFFYAVSEKLMKSLK